MISESLCFPWRVGGGADGGGPGAMAEFRVLGTVEILAGDESLDVGQPRQRAVLAALLADTGRPVAPSVLIDRVWGSAAPASPRSALYSYFTRLRQLLAVVRERTGTPVELVRRGGGYVLDVAADAVDLYRFRSLVERARTETGERARADVLREALALWKGEPLIGIDGPWAATMRAAWTQEQVDAVVAWAALELKLGNPGAVVGVLTGHAHRHPWNETLAAVLIRALSAAGRTADALAQYTAVRQRLAEDLGIDPGPELRAAQQAALAAGEAIPDSGQPAQAPAAVVPAQLPADVTAFTGRGVELAALDALLTDSDASPAVLISALSGTAGVGKTALAVHWAHSVRPRFPDGQLYVDLRGYDSDQPVTAATALAGFLTALGVPARDIPVNLHERAALYRTALSDRRMVVVLDNAATTEQVRPLLPGAGSCVVVVTSRDSLTGLVAVHGAHRVDLDLLPRSDAIALLRRLIGVRVEADTDAAAALIELCARLPLALRLAAELAVSRPNESLATLVRELTDRRRRLDLLDAGDDPRGSVTAVFSWSLVHLPAAAARAFRLLGLHPGPDTDAYGVAALVDIDMADADHILNRLARAHLVYPTRSGRYGMHDLLRAYAVRLTTEQDSAADRHAAQRRLLDYYLATAAAAMDGLYPAEAHRRPRVTPAVTSTPVLTNPGTARAWLDSERAALVAVAGQADRWPGHTVRLSAVLSRYLDGGHHAEAAALHDHARDAARRTGDQVGEAHALVSLGTAHYRLGRQDLALAHLRPALALFQRAGDEAGQARALMNLGNIEQWLGRYESATGYLRCALELFRRVGDPTGEAGALNNLGIGAERVGDYPAAAGHYGQALVLAQHIGDRVSTAHALNNLGIIEDRRNRYNDAGKYLDQALDLYRQLGDRTGQAWTLDSLGTVQLHLGHSQRAAELFEQARALFRQAGERDGEPWACNGLGEATYAAGDPATAAAHHAAALTAAAETGARDQEARAHAGLGRAHAACGDHARARDHDERAVDLYRALGMPEAEPVQAHLSTLVDSGRRL